MSAPDTNVEKQKSRHRPALWGIGAAVALAILAAIGMAAWNGPPIEEQAGSELVAPAGTE